MYLPNEYISIEIYKYAKQIENHYKTHNINRNQSLALSQIQATLSNIIPEIKSHQILETVIGMCEGTIPFDRYFGTCKCSNTEYTRNPRSRLYNKAMIKQHNKYSRI